MTDVDSDIDLPHNDLGDKEDDDDCVDDVDEDEDDDEDDGATSSTYSSEESGSDDLSTSSSSSATGSDEEGESSCSDAETEEGDVENDDADDSASTASSTTESHASSSSEASSSSSTARDDDTDSQSSSLSAQSQENGGSGDSTKLCGRKRQRRVSFGKESFFTFRPGSPVLKPMTAQVETPANLPPKRKKARIGVATAKGGGGASTASSTPTAQQLRGGVGFGRDAVYVAPGERRSEPSVSQIEFAAIVGEIASHVESGFSDFPQSILDEINARQLTDSADIAECAVKRANELPFSAVREVSPGVFEKFSFAELVFPQQILESSLEGCDASMNGIIPGMNVQTYNELIQKRLRVIISTQATEEEMEK